MQDSWPKAFCTLTPCHARKAFDVLEFFAGRANLSKVMKQSGYRAGRLDIMYRVETKGSTNPMDLLSPSGFAKPDGMHDVHIVTAFIYRSGHFTNCRLPAVFV